MNWASTKDSRIKKRGAVYWARFTKRGQTVEQSLETKSFEIAKKMVENIEQDVLLGVNWRREKEYFGTAWPDFLSDKSKGIKTRPARSNTLQGYISFGELYYLPNFKDVMLSDLEDAWEALVEKTRQEKPKMHLDNMRKYLMGFSSWAYRKGKIRTKLEFFDPDIKRKEERQQDGPGLAYSVEQLRKQREFAKKQSPRFYLFCLMAHFMGMRPSEITQLKKDRIDLGDNVIRLRKADTKNARARDVAIHTEVLKPLIAQMDANKGLSDYLFPNHSDKKRAMDPTGFKKYWYAQENPGRIYDFRHTFITHAICQGLNPAAVALMTGTSLKMIETRYLHFSAKDLNKEISKFHL